MSDGQCTPERVVDRIPCGLYLLTSGHDGIRAGVLARWVQRCAAEPPMVMVAIPKGQAVEPLIRDSRCFVLAQIDPADRLLSRLFAAPSRTEDPFDAISTVSTNSGAPIVNRAVWYLDCEVSQHIELDSDHRVYVGLVRSAGLLDKGTVLSKNGEKRAPKPQDGKRLSD